MKTTPRPPAEVSSTENVKRNLKSGKNLIDRILAQGPKWASVHYWSKHYSFLRDRDVVRSLEGKRSEAYMWLWLHRPRFSLEHKYKHNIDTNKTKVICANSKFSLRNVHSWKIFTSEKCSPLKNIHSWKIFTPEKYSPLKNIHTWKIFTSEKYSPL